MNGSTGEESSLNPFIYIEPVRGTDFSNREAVIKKISKITFQGKAQGNVWVVGERQIGKTSLLQQMERLHRDEPPIIKLYGTNREFKVLFLYFNCQIIKDESSFYQSLTQCLANHFDFKIKAKRDPYENFINWLKETYEKQYYIIFLLDEFDAFIEKFAIKSREDTGHFLDTLNVLKQSLPGLKDHQKAFGLICAANSSIGELTKDLTLTGSGFTFFEEIELANFSEAQVAELAAQYLVGNQIQFSEAELRFCYKMTHGYPLFIQNLLSIMYEEKQNAPAGAAEKDFLKSIKNEYGKSFKNIVEGWEKQNKLTERTKVKLKEIARGAKEEFKEYSTTLASKFFTDLLKTS
ncbi:MAG TPA: AAA-like domain-containing protein [Candidatus Deferrimicrobium sp.]|nr:AAA-like domain-containing protein [Candidatus Deferrimicrobium sp.]